MPGIFCHSAFAEKVYRLLSMPIDKVKFMSGNLIPDLAITDKKVTHYRKDASIKGLFVPDMERVKNDLFVLKDPIKLGMFSHLYLDCGFIEEFLIPEFIWGKDDRYIIINPRNGQEWHPDLFFRQDGGVYYNGFKEINSLLLKDEHISLKTLNELPEILPKTGIEVYDTRREKSWRAELEEYIAQKREYTGDIFDYENLISFIDKKAIQLATEILKTEYEK